MIAGSTWLQTRLGINPSTFRSWVRRGHVTKRGHDQYDVDEVVACWKAHPKAHPDDTTEDDLVAETKKWCNI